MGAYSSFAQDFPLRCRKLLEEQSLSKLDMEVTIMLSVASSGFTMPFERLRPVDKKPDYEDVERLKKARKQMNILLGKKFIGSTVWPLSDASSWLHRKEVESVKGDPNQWPELYDGKSTIVGRDVHSILAHLRNALAHGNILTLGNPIDKIIFLSRYRDEHGCLTDKFNMLAVTSSDLRKFLLNWFTFLATLNIPEAPDQETVIDLLHYDDKD